MYRRLLFVLLAIVVGLANVFQVEADHDPPIPITINPTNMDAGSEPFLLEVTSQGEPFDPAWKIWWDPTPSDFTTAKTLTTEYDGGKLYGTVTSEEVPCPDESVWISVVEVNALDIVINTHSMTETFSINNNPPIANNDEYTIDEDATLGADGPESVLANDTTGDDLSCGESLSATVASQPSNGTLDFNANGSFTYDPNENFNGTDTFTYSVSDGTDTVTGTVTITVTAVNDAPVANSQSVTTPEDTPVDITLTASDVESETLTYTITTEPTNGALSGSLPNVTYTPNDNYFGSDEFQFQVTDGTSNSNIAVVTLSVDPPVNDAPVADDETVNTTEDTPLLISTADLLDGDIDPDGDSLSVTGVNPASSEGGTVSLDGSTVTYTPPDNFSGTDEFIYTVSDGTDTDTGTVTVEVAPVNDTPVAVADTYDTVEGTTLNTDAESGVLSNDTDVEDGNALEAQLVTSPSTGALDLAPDGSFSYTPPDSDFSGSVTFDYEACDADGSCSTAVVTINVLGVNDAPFAGDDSYSTVEDGGALEVAATGVLANDTDVEGNALFSVKVDDPQNGTVTLNADGSFSYTPDPDFNGTDTFTYQADDQQASNNLSNLATVTITITAEPDAPVAQGQTVDTEENTPVDITLGATDADGDVLTYTITTDPTNGALSGSPPNVTYTPNDNFSGTDTFEFQVTDGTSNSEPATVTIRVAPTNNPPVAVDDTRSATEDTPLPIDSTDLLANDTDIDGDSLSVTGVSPSSSQGGSVTLDGPTVTYTPPADFSGTDSFTYTVSDGMESDTGTVTVTVNPAPDPPEAEDQTVGTNEDMAVEITLTATDVDGDSLTFTTTVPALGAVSAPSAPSCSGTTCTATVTYTPNADHFGPDSFTFTVSDGSITSTGTVNITVASVNDAPSFTPGPNQTLEADPGAQTVSGWATDINPGAPNESSQALTFLVTSDNPAFFVEEPAISSDGTLTFTPAPEASGSVTLTVQLQDNGGTANGGQDTSSPATVTITVVEEPTFTIYLPFVTNGDGARSSSDSISSSPGASNQFALVADKPVYSPMRR